LTPGPQAAFIVVVTVIAAGVLSTGSGSSNKELSTISAGSQFQLRMDTANAVGPSNNSSGGPDLLCGCGCAPVCGEGGPSHVFLTIAIYSDEGTIVLNGSTYQNGQVATLEAGIGVNLHVSAISSGFTFEYWESDVGSFGSNTASSTTFTPVDEEDIGTLAVILEWTAKSNGPWAGCIMDNEAYGVSCAGGTYYNVPPTTYVGSGYPITDENSIWVGIGGVNGNQTLWQAGIIVTYTGNYLGGGGYQLYWQPFAEAPGNSWQGWKETGPESSNFPSALIISVCSSGGGNSAHVQAYYAGSGSVWWNATYSGYWPDTMTAEWIVEDPLVSASQRAPLGAFAPFGVETPSWTINGASHNEFLGSLAYLSLEDTVYTTQYVTPGSITYGFSQYSLTYST
jgi:hypothetical protein